MLISVYLLFSQGVIVVSDDDSNTEDNTWWIKELFLYESDRATLLNDVELSDAVIHAAQRLLKTQYPYIRGLQSPLYSQGLKFRPISRTDKSVQILNTGTCMYVYTCMIGRSVCSSVCLPACMHACIDVCNCV